MAETQFVTSGQTAATATHKVLRNTYILLFMMVLSSQNAGLNGPTHQTKEYE